MPVDNRRLFAPEKTMSPSLFKKAAKRTVVVDENQLRSDGRQLDELRPLLLNVGVVSQANGSAYFEVGKTKIIASVYGPREIFRKRDVRIRSQLRCEFKYAPYSCEMYQSHIPNSEEKDISMCLQEALESVVLLHRFPKSTVDIFILVLENDGGVTSHALTCACAALANAGFQIYDIAVGCTLMQFGTLAVIDPNIEEENQCENDQSNQGKITVGMMPSSNQVILLLQEGSVSVNNVNECMKVLAKQCEHLHMFVKDNLQKPTQNKGSDAHSNIS